MLSNRRLVGAVIAVASLVIIGAGIIVAAIWGEHSGGDHREAIGEVGAVDASAQQNNGIEGQGSVGNDRESLGASDGGLSGERVAYQIRIDTADRSRAVSPTLYGIFYEDINYAGDGGLYGELIQNRSFEFDQPMFAWKQVVEGDSAGTVEVEDSETLNEHNPRYLVITADTAGDGIGVSNAGYDGIFIESEKIYDVRLYARADDASSRGQRLHITLRDTDHTVIGSCEIMVLTGEWKEYACAIAAEATTTKAQLVVVATERGSVALDMISLFPRHTWKERENGVRADLAEMLAEMKPTFLRFPGGCIVEGGSIENRYRWKNTIGDTAEREVQPNQWARHYYQSFGLGFDEYFQLAKDLGAEPLPVVYAGITSCDGNPPMIALSDMQPFIDDALDLIEYANGDASTEWGAKRIANGYPEPFDLKYVAIGNELWGTNYYTRYRMIYEAIKEKYPDMELIFSAGAFPNDLMYHEAYAWLAKNGDPADIVDEHMYQSPEWFINNADRYDHFDRNGPKVFVGEYAAHTVGRRNNMEAALAEAAFMTGLERNSDIVAMASYAPLFGRQGYTQWQPNLIWFDQSRVYGTPSYEVQKLFANHVGDYVLPTEITRYEEKKEASIGGSILLGTWLTQVEYDDVKVTDADDNVLFEDDFTEADSLQNWRSSRGAWTVEGGVLKQSSDADDVRLYLQEGHDWTDYTLSLRARKTGGNEGMLIGFAVEGSDDYYWWNIGGWNNTRTAVEKAVGGVKTIVSQSVSRGVTTGEWLDIRIEIRGATVKCYLNDELIHEWDESSDGPIFSVSTYDEESGEVIAKVVNVADEDKLVEVVLDGETAGKVSTEATVIVLQSERLSDENSLDEPERVAPQESRLSGVGDQFEHLFPARSVTILRLPM